MRTTSFGYHGIILNIDLSTGNVFKSQLQTEDIKNYIGGRGLGMKLLWDRIKSPGMDPLSGENPLIFLPGPFSGLPIPCASRTCVVTKSPCTSPVESEYAHASTVSYSNFGGFFGPEIKFAGYDAVIISGRSAAPVYIRIEDDNVQIKDAAPYWGMGTDGFDKKFTSDLKDRQFCTCYIGPAGENLVRHASIIHTASRAAGRGVGCVMGAKNLKAIAVKGTRMPEVADQTGLLDRITDARDHFTGLSRGRLLSYFLRKSGTTSQLEKKSGKGIMAVKNFREGTFPGVDKIGADAAKKDLWVRSYSCYCCPLACKKSGVVKDGPYKGVMVHDGPEYETGTMLGANLMISDLGGLMKLIYDGDDLGLDIISAGNVIGFLMEAREKGLIDLNFLDGIDLAWGNADAAIKMLEKIARRDGIGDPASKGVKALAETLRGGSEFAMHVKGMELAAHNVHANPAMGLCYATSNKGGCHQNGNTAQEQNLRVVIDSVGICRFACMPPVGLTPKTLATLLESITGIKRNEEELLRAGERGFNLEKVFNYREGFRRRDDTLPQRFFSEPLTIGPEKGAVLDRASFETQLSDYYRERGWDTQSSKPGKTRMSQLGLSFALL
ncbi:MAG: aldehyde ferredoxin oxidoreductase family protein [Proteobacteria bacterium]|nr:aldehyde ferredoxin oxidoreductase family protein [Pseudomonadota bacterium]